MKGHPGGREHSLRMLELAALPPGARILDMGAGAGETLALLRESGFDAVGIDLSPRTPEVLRADCLCAPFPDGSFDAIISQCAFFVSGRAAGSAQAPQARRKASAVGRVLRSARAASGGRGLLCQIGGGYDGAVA